MRSRTGLVLNFVLSQVGWFAAVLGAGQGHAMAGTAVALACAGLHLVLAPQRKAEAAAMLGVAAVGTVWDSAVVSLGLLHYTAGQWQPWLAPYWITALWLLFATTLNLSLRWLQGRWWLAAVFGAVAGPLSFSAGAALGAAQFSDPVRTPLVLAAGWAVLLPLAVWIAQRAERAGEPSAPPPSLSDLPLATAKRRP